MLEDTKTTPITLQADIGNWTRTIKRNENTERSIIDYIIMTDDIKNNTKLIHIDEIGSYKLKGKEETDHNTIIIETDLSFNTNINKATTTNFKDGAGWEKFNNIIESKFRHQAPANYDEYEKAVKTAIKKSFKRITITRGIYK